MYISCRVNEAERQYSGKKVVYLKRATVKDLTKFPANIPERLSENSCKRWIFFIFIPFSEIMRLQ